MAAIHIVIAYNAHGQCTALTFDTRQEAASAAMGIESCGTHRAATKCAIYKDGSEIEAKVSEFKMRVDEMVNSERSMIRAEQSSPCYSES